MLIGLVVGSGLGFLWCGLWLWCWWWMVSMQRMRLIRRIILLVIMSGLVQGVELFSGQEMMMLFGVFFVLLQVMRRLVFFGSCMLLVVSRFFLLKELSYRLELCGLCLVGFFLVVLFLVFFVVGLLLFWVLFLFVGVVMCLMFRFLLLLIVMWLQLELVSQVFMLVVWLQLLKIFLLFWMISVCVFGLICSILLLRSMNGVGLLIVILVF